MQLRGIQPSFKSSHGCWFLSVLSACSNQNTSFTITMRNAGLLKISTSSQCSENKVATVHQIWEDSSDLQVCACTLAKLKEKQAYCKSFLCICLIFSETAASFLIQLLCWCHKPSIFVWHNSTLFELVVAVRLLLLLIVPVGREPLRCHKLSNLLWHNINLLNSVLQLSCIPRVPTLVPCVCMNIEYNFSEK